ncbi:archaetidylserine decarboxylase [Phytohalomonas tamaricis]|uniref:archaetidylserine decarboxylase n=1 Tax=Phytohalomonas tamaricis TaxID=2081032 RepID=UPI000D0B0E60|nr:archaetidylserine decarboxylase [Phytohalomonas tamaricis]
MNRDQLFAWIQYPIPHHLLSRLVGRIADCQLPWVKDIFIKRFIRAYDIDMSEALHSDPHAYSSFNEFFTRPLKEGARPIGEGIVSPADGVLSQYGEIKDDTLIQAKGHHYSLTALLGGDEALSAPFRDGRFGTVYLSPSNYHRVHMPCAGTLRQTVYVPGRLFSVNSATTHHVPSLFARNERLVCIFDTEYGPMALVLIGAMIVAAIETVWAGQITPLSAVPQNNYFDRTVTLDKGEEIGRFKLGSSVVMCFPNTVDFDEPLSPEMKGRKVLLGQKLAAPIAYV